MHQRLLKTFEGPDPTIDLRMSDAPGLRQVPLALRHTQRGFRGVAGEEVECQALACAEKKTA